MEQNIHQSRYSIEQFVQLEQRIWQAFCTGDVQLDSSMLSEDFVGIYPDGNLDRQGHCQQLANGPLAKSYIFSNEAIEVLQDNHVLFSYRATWVRVGGDPLKPEVMDVYSKWRKIDGQWKNFESRDVPVVD